MNNRFKCVFDKIHAEEDLKEKTKAYLRSRMLKGRASVSGRIPLRPLVAVASVLIFIFVTAGFRFYFTPSVVISIDINPSIELGINGLILLVAGGIAYTIGAILYGLGRKHKYMHSVFHLFIVLGSLLHFFCILFYVV